MITHVDYSGWFPFCPRVTNPEDEPLPDAYSVELSLEEAIEWWWRIRKWEVEVKKDDFTDTSILEMSSAGPTSELELVCPKPREFFTSNPDFDPGSAEDAWGIGLYGITDFDPSVIFWGGTWRPQIFVTYGVDATGAVVAEWDADQKEISFDFGSGNYLKARPAKWWTYGGLYDPDTGQPV